MSDDSGSFSFRRLQGGTYTLMIDAGSEFEIAYETIDIIEAPRRRGDPGQTQTVQITLSPKQNESKTGGTVDASNAGVPEAARMLYKDALEAAQADNNKKAIELLEESLKIYPNYMSALNELGLRCMKVKKLDKAEESLRQAVKIAPEAFTPRLNYGILLIQKKDFVKPPQPNCNALRKKTAHRLPRTFTSEKPSSIWQSTTKPKKSCSKP